ncbi:triose-phosphate isomerase [Georgenia deserti]|uniref:Triosephosphate isomerase n=1 Tax=Georgenia deserti TaxID=2093781 RepID=A0ABW4L2Y4_9MICO
MTDPQPPRPVVCVGLKAYFGHAETLAWFDRAADQIDAGRAAGISVGVMPVATSLASLAPRAADCGIALGAQDCSAESRGPFTGELPAELLAEVGASFVEVGHAERRRLGDTDAIVTAKTAAAVAAGLTPFICAGEQRPTDPESAANEVIGQVRRVLGAVERGCRAILAYEPHWAIGADRPAPTDHIAAVLNLVREAATGIGELTLLYGGTAGPGMYRDLADVADGLALGRRAHDVEVFGAVLDEMRPEGVPTDGA